MSLRHTLVALALLIGPAAAQDGTNTVVYYRAGNWEAFSGTGPNAGSFCGVKTGNAHDGRGFMLRFRIGEDRLIFRTRKPSWNIPAGTHIPVTMQFGSGAPWMITGTGEQDVVEWSIPQTAMGDFDTQFRLGTVLWIGFPGGNEAPWSVSLAGSNAIGHTLTRCIRELSAQAAPTQPYSGPTSPAPQLAPAPTQPFPTAPQAPETAQPATPLPGAQSVPPPAR